MAEPRKSAPKKAAEKAPAAPALADTGQDFVVKELQTGADDTIKLAYGSMTLAPAKYLELFSKVGEEYMKFVARRMEAQAGRFAALSRCSTPEEIAKEEMTFFGRAAQDYAEQFDRFAEATHGAAEQAEKEAGSPS